MSGAPLINMRETKFNNNSRFKTLSDEDLFADEAEPLNSILSKFKYWPRNGNKMYTRRSMLCGGFFLFSFGFLISFFFCSRISFSYHYHTFSHKKGFLSFQDVVTMLKQTQFAHQLEYKLSNNNVTNSNYEEAVLLKKHFESYKFDQVSPIISSEIFLSFKNKNTPDALEIIVDKGEIRYRNVRNTTYKFIIPEDAREINNATNNISGLPVYGNFGTEDDFNFLMEKAISLHGCIVLLRLGRIPILEKVTSAFKRGANGVLLFADPQQYPNVNLFSVSEEITPTLLADLQKLYSSLESQRNNPENGVAVQVIEAMTAQNILREMAGANKPPDSWKGSLDALYSIGPGFVYPSWRLVLYSYFLNVKYKTHDVVAYLKGDQEDDRYIIIGNKRRTLRSDEKTFDSINAMMEVSRILAELKKNRDWKPTRTIVFCSFGLEETERYSTDSWLQMYKHIVVQRTVAYLEMKQPIQGLEFFNVQTSPLLQNIFENISALVENPNTEEKLNEKKTLFNVWHQQKSLLDYRHPIVENKIYNTTANTKSRNSFKPDSTQVTVGDELFASLGITTLTFGYANKEEKQSSNENTESVVNIYEYENAIVQLWTLLTFSLADSLILPFNISGYSTVLNNFYDKFLLQNEIRLRNTSAMEEYNKLKKLISNLSVEIQIFQESIQLHDDMKYLKNRALNDKLMQIDRLLMCYEEHHKYSSFIKNEHPIFISLQESFIENDTLDTTNVVILLKKAVNCINQIHYLMNDFKS